eukprot:GEMP01122029.1.p3 GENE.GEMP01122029.1~~GEMP01122029.1.p3  ORF type:complete len:105 (+),score=10.72 GEMP01122029.1:202-516(+)
MGWFIFTAKQKTEILGFLFSHQNLHSDFFCSRPPPVDIQKKRTAMLIHKKMVPRPFFCDGTQNRKCHFLMGIGYFEKAHSDAKKQKNGPSTLRRNVEVEAFFEG